MSYSLRDVVADWNQRTGERSKLQLGYAVVAASLLVGAGVVGLINYQLGQYLLGLALVAGGLCVVNAIFWVLLEAFVLRRLPKPARATRTTRATRTATSSKTKASRG